ncbi:TM2 domain-containing protein [Hymenobacter sp. 15J16-1T3B]|uniref:TM2 domain-containing protein n=1 Tax=Hymenobacter sp. 15J16-1T3B TaxID=2886941 RepID=UPI001D10868C|nr:TM2 domain-containing protein [Hymenobacter sp. 15J16-1T3B]MCC3159127.1 TM2 domain-containing protein [Hymenobacter sp. 15J16-1T3B]
MNHFSARTAALLLAVATFASCSRAQYAFTPAPSAYHAVAVEAPAPATMEAIAPPAPAAPAADLMASAAPAAPAARPAAAPSRPAAPVTVPGAANAVAPATRKALHREVRQAVKQARRQAAAAPAAEGKSQLTALLLEIFLGIFGVHRFYLGYTGRGLLYIALLLTSWLIIPFLVLAVLTTIDLVLIITGDLKPKNGEYAKTFEDMGNNKKNKE